MLADDMKDNIVSTRVATTGTRTTSRRWDPSARVWSSMHSIPTCTGASSSLPCKGEAGVLRPPHLQCQQDRKAPIRCWARRERASRQVTPLAHSASSMGSVARTCQEMCKVPCHRQVNTISRHMPGVRRGQRRAGAATRTGSNRGLRRHHQPCTDGVRHRPPVCSPAG